MCGFHSSRICFAGERARGNARGFFNGVYRSLTLISRERFNLIKRHRVCEASRVHFSRVSPPCACTCTSNVVSVLIGDHVDYRWSMGKRDLLSGHFVAACSLTCLPRYPYRRKNIAYPARSESGDFLLAVSRRAVTYPRYHNLPAKTAA